MEKLPSAPGKKEPVRSKKKTAYPQSLRGLKRKGGQRTNLFRKGSRTVWAKSGGGRGHRKKRGSDLTKPRIGKKKEPRPTSLIGKKGP